jgi:hypothetical protein
MVGMLMESLESLVLMLLGAGGAIFGWVLKRHIAQDDETANKVDALGRRMDEHKLYAAENYAKKVDLTIAVGLWRAELSDFRKDMKDGFEILDRDVKNILEKMNRH